MSQRLFIAADFSEEVEAAAAEIARQMRRTLEMPGTRITWVRPGNLHMTLKFLGDTSEDRIPAVTAALDGVAAARAPFGVRVKGAGGFPGTSRPRVLWLALAEGAPEMSALAADVEAAVTAAGFERDGRGFRPHLTVARVKDAGRADYAAACARVNDRDAGACAIDHLTLYRSVLQPTGPVYTAVHRAPFTR